MNELRLGLVGLGHGETLIEANRPEYDEIPIRVTALCDTNAQRLKEAGHQHSITNLTTEFSELLARDDIDIVGIYTPGPLHAQQVLAALDAGKHVMMTKAMAYTMQEVESLVEAVDRTGLTLLITQTLRGRYDLMDAKRVCDSGALGELFMAEAAYTHDLRPVYQKTPWRATMPQDLLLGGACHPIDCLRWFMGDIDEVHCYGIRSGIAPEYPKEDNFVINVKFSSGKIGHINAFYGVVEPPGVPMNGFAVYGTKGTIRDGVMRFDPEHGIPERTYTAEYRADASAIRGHRGEMAVMLRHMADCVLNGTTPWVGVRDGASVVSTGLACWESIRTGQSVKVRNEF
jgi:predicted dehydrogenase